MDTHRQRAIARWWRSLSPSAKIAIPLGVVVLIIVLSTLNQGAGSSASGDKAACQIYSNFLNYHGAHETLATDLAWLQRAAGRAQANPLKSDLAALVDAEKHGAHGMGNGTAVTVAITAAAISDCRNLGH